MPGKCPELQSVCQIAIVVKDIQQAAKRWADVFNVPVPEAFLTDTKDVSHIRYHGQPTPARAKLAFFQMGQVSLELIEPVGGKRGTGRKRRSKPAESSGCKSRTRKA